MIEKLALVLYCGGIGGYTAAVAAFENPDVASTVAGLRAGEYLVAPGQGLPTSVSGIPMMPSPWESGDLAALLLNHARSIVKDPDWMVDPGRNLGKTFADRIRRMNQSFLTVDHDPEARAVRWAPPGRKPLLFVEAIWVDGDLPLFGCNAVVEEEPAPAVLSFDTTQAGYMRISEFDGHIWKLDSATAFRNAWRIGSRYYVLTYTSGYEGFSVQLMEIVPGTGLVPSGLVYGAGC